MMGIDFTDSTLNLEEFKAILDCLPSPALKAKIIAVNYDFPNELLKNFGIERQITSSYSKFTIIGPTKDELIKLYRPEHKLNLQFLKIPVLSVEEVNWIISADGKCLDESPLNRRGRYLINPDKAITSEQREKDQRILEEYKALYITNITLRKDYKGDQANLEIKCEGSEEPDFVRELKKKLYNAGIIKREAYGDGMDITDNRPFDLEIRIRKR